MSGLRVYNSISGKVESVTPGPTGGIGLYACGPTVYGLAHIGNFRSFITADLIVRMLTTTGIPVRFVGNITDVGHLSEDDVADARGEDKMERALRSSPSTKFENIWDLARHYAEAFLEDWDALQLTQPAVRPRATEHVAQQIDHISALMEAGFAYETPSGVYFHVPSFPGYGKLSGNRNEAALEASSRDLVEDVSKRDPRDFALWKKDANHLMRWHSPWGWGYPGWHIECSAMASAYLGETLDIHTGGIDNKFPHHECEIAQSESRYRKPFARYWVHTGHLQVEGAKMAKSGGNFFTVRDLINSPDSGGRGIPALALRMALMAAKYREPFNFTLKHLSDTAMHWERIQETKEMISLRISDDQSGADVLSPQLDQLYERIHTAMSEDLNTATAIAVVLEGVRFLRSSPPATGADARAAQGWFARVDAMLGFIGIKSRSTALPAALGMQEVEIEAQLAERLRARKLRDFARADAIRDALIQQGIEISDSPSGTQWRRLPQRPLYAVTPSTEE